MFGSETEPRDVLEYIVFEKHVAEIYGVWRMHDKIRAKGHVGPGDAVITTMKKPKPVSVSEKPEPKKKVEEEEFSVLKESAWEDQDFEALRDKEKVEKKTETKKETKVESKTETNTEEQKETIKTDLKSRVVGSIRKLFRKSKKGDWFVLWLNYHVSL